MNSCNSQFTQSLIILWLWASPWLWIYSPHQHWLGTNHATRCGCQPRSSSCVHICPAIHVRGQSYIVYCACWWAQLPELKRLIGDWDWSTTQNLGFFYSIRRQWSHVDFENRNQLWWPLVSRGIMRLKSMPRIPRTVYRYCWAYPLFYFLGFPLFSCWFPAVD